MRGTQFEEMPDYDISIHDVVAFEDGNIGSVHEDGVTVHRAFELEVVGGLAETLKRLPSRRRREKRDLEAVRGLVEAFEPEVAVQWGMWNAPRSISALIEGLLPGRNSYYLCDYWLTLPTAYSQQLENPADRALMRVPKTRINVRSAYEFYAGMGADGEPGWTFDADGRAPVFTTTPAPRFSWIRESEMVGWEKDSVMSSPCWLLVKSRKAMPGEEDFRVRPVTASRIRQ